MSDLEFNLPLNKESLLDGGTDFYYVRQVCIVSQIRDYLKQARDAFHYDGPASILTHFDTYYSIIYHEEKLDIDIVAKTVKDLIKPCQQLSVYLESNLDDLDATSEIRVKTLNILKMLIYLFTQITILLENKIDNKNRNDLNTSKKGRGRIKSKKSEDTNFDLEIKQKQLTLLLNILQLPIHKLWDPPVCEEQFTNLIADMCFTFLINPALKYEKEMWNSIFYIFGTLIKNYNYSLTFTVRLTQAIKDQEHLESIVPGGIQILVSKFNCIGLVRELVRELTEWQSDESFQDTTGSKHCSVILTQMTALMPELMLTEVVYLLKYLNSSSYTLRNCILSIITEVVITVLSKEDITEEQTRIRNKLLNKLKTYICDISAHVRSKVLQQWARLHAESAIPTYMQADLLKKACNRLQDKATLVRKNAMQLLTTFLKCNPYAAKLDLDFYKQELLNEINKFNKMNSDDVSNDILENIKNKENDWLKIKNDIIKVIQECLETDDEEDMELNSSTIKSKEVVKSYLFAGKYKEAFLICREFINADDEQKDELEDMSAKKQADFYATFMQSIYTDMGKEAANIVNININKLAQLTPEEIEAFKKCEENVKYLNDVVIFLEILDGVFPLVKNLLKSATMTDVNEAIDFFVTAHQFQIKRSSEGLAAMLAQMNTTEQDRKKAVIDAYRTVFLSYEGHPKDKPATIVKRLISLLQNVNANDIPYLSNVIMQWAEKGDLENSVIQQLWHMFTGHLSESSNDDRLAALKLLTMIATGNKTVIERNMNLVIEFVFSDKSLEDPRYFIFGCNMLGIMEDEINMESTKPSFRITVEDPMWELLINILFKICEKKDIFCHAVIIAAIELIYKICQKPDILCEKIIKNVPFIKDSNTNNKIDTTYLACFCHLLGEITIRQFSFLDSTVYKELKRRNNLKDEQKKTEKQQKKKDVANVSKASASCRTPANNSNDADESYMDGAPADDSEAEYIVNICEHNIVTTNLLGNYVPMLVHIVRHPHRFLDEELQASAVLALIRFMNVSSKICNDNLHLIMTALEKSKYASVKNNIYVSIADLLHRYPNIIEPWSQHIFKTVKDEDETVRMTAVTILFKLIMEDMLRVKGSIADLALCIVDKSPVIVQMTEEFFHLLAQKGNTIYNVLPDVISNISNDRNQIDQETFKKVMTFLMSLISKDKQIESLVEKLCVRFKLSMNPRVWRDGAYCLTLLNYNEKGLLRLEENYASYKSSLEDDTVYDLFISIVNKYKNSNKEEIKVVTKKLDQLIRTGEVADDDNILNESKTKKTKPKRGKKARVQFDD